MNGILEDGTAMNDKRNLMVLCEECHDKIHAGTLTVGDMKMTSEGPVREIQVRPASSSKEEKTLKKGKWSEEEMEWIVSTLKQYSALSLKSIRALLSSKYGVEISEGVLGKMRREF
jgi:hypothetical protein